MTKEGYEKIERWFSAHPFCLSLLKFLNRWLTLAVYCCYPSMLAVLAYQKDLRLIRVIAVPALVFGLVSVMRRIWDLPRPYESLGIRPLIPREKKGRSFPSRHVASVTIIALAGFYVWLPIGIVLSFMGLGIALVRPLAGIHFLRDVVAGILISLLIGVIGFWVI